MHSPPEGACKCCISALRGYELWEEQLHYPPEVTQEAEEAFALSAEEDVEALASIMLVSATFRREICLLPLLCTPDTARLAANQDQLVSLDPPAAIQLLPIKAYRWILWPLAKLASIFLAHLAVCLPCILPIPSCIEAARRSMVVVTVIQRWAPVAAT
jgi:hypothetical protein